MTQLSFNVNQKTLLTDFLSQSNSYWYGLLLSERVERILREFVISPRAFIRSDVNYKKQTHLYYLLHLHRSQFDEIDFDRNSFYLEEASTSKRILTYKKLNRNEYLDKSMKLDLDKKIVTENAVVNVKSRDILDYDMMLISFGGFRIVVSTELRGRLLREKFTGVEFSYSSYLLLKAD